MKNNVTQPLQKISADEKQQGVPLDLPLVAGDENVAPNAQAPSYKDLIYIYKNDTQLGPYTENEARMHWAAGILDGNDFAWHPGMEGWVPIKDLFGVPMVHGDHEGRVAPPRLQEPQQNSSWSMF